MPVATAETEPAGATSASKQGAVLWTELGHTHPLHCHASSRIQPAETVSMWSVSNVMLSGAGVHDCESPWRRWLWHPALSSSQQPPAGGSSDMESGGRCLYRQHYTYTAHIYTNFKFGIPYTVSKMEKRLSTEANSLPSLMCISPLCWYWNSCGWFSHFQKYYFVVLYNRYGGRRLASVWSEPNNNIHINVPHRYLIIRLIHTQDRDLIGEYD